MITLLDAFAQVLLFVVVGWIGVIWLLRRFL